MPQPAGTFGSLLPVWRAACDQLGHLVNRTSSGRPQLLRQRLFSTSPAVRQAEGVKNESQTSLFPEDECPSEGEPLCSLAESDPPKARAAVERSAVWGFSRPSGLADTSSVQSHRDRSGILYFSGWESERLCRRSKAANHVPFSVRRTASDNVPVYLHWQNNRNKVSTVVRKVQGSKRVSEIHSTDMGPAVALPCKS
ncbi:mitochondrial large subunit ribosomal protein [Cystoisospora suis]|uniref:Mitochondrial large subunit ribosomal protein n=1 Tax=Cystoisospora suis TaxID=483139 RepID=A0A2C6LCD3_9APIC|nr:mitochondrial large subunit ribosomal protein [Cystoisospora suis]